MLTHSVTYKKKKLNAISLERLYLLFLKFDIQLYQNFEHEKITI